MSDCINQQQLDEIFPPEKTDEFFDALYGGAEEGAYFIKLICNEVTNNTADLAFELHRRPNQCLKCSLTYGLPKVFERHPVINIQSIAKSVAHLLGWPDVSWSLDRTQEVSDDLHVIPLRLERKN